MEPAVSRQTANIIAKQLIRKVMLFAGLATIIFTVFIGFITFHNETRKFNQQFDKIEKSYMDVIRSALWVDDKETVRAVLLGICTLPGIEYADIHVNHSVLCEAAGEKKSDGNLARFFSITHVFNEETYQLGILHVQGSSDYLTRTIIRTVIGSGLIQAATIFTICICVLWLIYNKVIRRLSKITLYTSALSLESLDAPLVMPKTNDPPDEIDALTRAVNLMRKNLSQAFKDRKSIEEQLQEHLKNLERIVDERTADITLTNEQLQMEIDERKKIEKERESLIDDLKKALANVKQLSGLLPICSHCKKIRDDQGYWQQIEQYIHERSEAQFSHGICQECLKKYYPDFDIHKD